MGWIGTKRDGVVTTILEGDMGWLQLGGEMWWLGMG